MARNFSEYDLYNCEQEVSNENTSFHLQNELHNSPSYGSQSQHTTDLTTDSLQNLSSVNYAHHESIRQVSENGFIKLMITTAENKSKIKL